jgi:hypothetical protein
MANGWVYFMNRSAARTVRASSLLVDITDEAASQTVMAGLVPAIHDLL